MPEGEEAIHEIHEALPERFQGATCWLDSQQGSWDRSVRSGIAYSRNVVVFLTRGATESEKWQREMAIALGARRNVVLFGETDDKKGKPSIDELIHQCPQNLKCIFHQNVIIPYFSDPAFRSVSFDKMARVLAQNPELESLRAPKQKKDMVYFHLGHDAEDAEVFPIIFRRFAAVCGLPLPGSSTWAIRWSSFEPNRECTAGSWAIKRCQAQRLTAQRNTCTGPRKLVQLLLLICSLLCALRSATPEGPGFLDYLAVAQMGVFAPLLLLLMAVTLRVLRCNLLHDLLQNHIECIHEAQRLRRILKRLAFSGMCLTALLAIWGMVGYLPGFFSTYYVDRNTNGGSDVLMAFGVIGFVHGAAFILVWPLAIGLFFCVLSVVFTVQELFFMGLVSSFNELHSDIAHSGLQVVAANPAGMNIKETDLYRFQERYLKCWGLYKKIQWRLAAPFLVFWALEVPLMGWSIWSLSQGFGGQTDQRATRLRDHWPLVVRWAWLMANSPWFGAGCYVLGLLPWGSIFYASLIRRYCRRLLFTNINLRTVFLRFVADLELEFGVLLLQATPKALVVVIPILLVNTLGYIADGTRLLVAL
ncbi:unnamed protein product [Effrenium voratum]|nr:unnamed protein product [Effrenium voratum]